MNRTVLTQSRWRRSTSMLGLAAIGIVVVAIGMVWMLVRNGPATIVADQAVPEVALVESAEGGTLRPGAGVRPADAFSAQLDALRRQAMNVASRDAANVYGESLEALAQAGRQAFLDNRLPTTANDYTVYLDDLRRQAQMAQSADGLPANANEFSEWLDQLRRMR